MGLSAEAVQILHAMRQGAAVKAHRTLDGTKIHKVHPLTGDAFAVSAAAVHLLEQRGWLRSNLKFPVATYSLTEAGRNLSHSSAAQWRQSLYRWFWSWCSSR